MTFARQRISAGVAVKAGENILGRIEMFKMVIFIAIYQLSHEESH